MDTAKVIMMIVIVILSMLILFGIIWYCLLGKYRLPEQYEAKNSNQLEEDIKIVTKELHEELEKTSGKKLPIEQGCISNSIINTTCDREKVATIGVLCLLTTLLRYLPEYLSKSLESEKDMNEETKEKFIKTLDKAMKKLASDKRNIAKLIHTHNNSTSLTCRPYSRHIPRALITMGMDCN